MKSILFICLLTFSSSLFAKYTTEQISVDIPGYGSVPYILWQHPLQKGWDFNFFLNQTAIEKMKTIIPEGSTVIDIGAHTGDSSVLFSLATGKTGTVIAFEPSHFAFEVLKQNAAIHPNIVPFNFAITERAGVFHFLFHGAEQFNGQFVQKPTSGSVNVQGVNLESFITQNFRGKLQDIKFIKIDCEGYDLNIIKSIATFLLTYRPILSCEVFPDLTREQKVDYFLTLQKLGYKMYIDPYAAFFDAQNLDVYKALDLNTFADIVGTDVFCFPTNF